MNDLTSLLERLGLAAAPAKEKETEKPAADPADQIAAANKRVRDSATWLLTSFAAVGAILVAGLQLSDVGKLTGDTPDARVVATLLGLAAAAVGVSVAIGYTAAVLAPIFNSFARADQDPEVTEAVLGDTELIGVDYAALKKNVKLADTAIETARTKGEDSPEYAQALKTRAEWEKSKRAALTMIGAETLWRRYKKGRRAVIAGVFLVLAGTVAFAWGANPPETESDAPATLGVAPQLLDVTLTKAGVAALAEKRGCKTVNVSVLAIGGEAGKREVVTIPSGQCATVRFILTPGLGTATAP